MAPLKLVRNVLAMALIVVVALLAICVALPALLAGVVAGAAVAVFKTSFNIGHDSIVEGLKAWGRP
jgi:hypothetical protein